MLAQPSYYNIQTHTLWLTDKDKRNSEEKVEDEKNTKLVNRVNDITEILFHCTAAPYLLILISDQKYIYILKRITEEKGKHTHTHSVLFIVWILSFMVFIQHLYK